MTATALDLTAGSGAATECGGAVPRLQAEAVAYLEPAPIASINDYGGPHYAPAVGNNVGIGVGFAEFSSGVGPYCIGLLYRAELEADGTKDLLDVLHGDQYGLLFQSGRAYSLHYDLQMMEAAGLRLRRSFDLGEVRSFHLTFALGGSLLQAIQGRDEWLNGGLTATSASYAVGTAVWLRTDSDLSPASFNPFVGAGHPTGRGFSTDVHLKAANENGTSIDFVVMDAYGQIYWRGTRRSLKVADNATIRYDVNANREAFITGQDSRVDVTERIDAKYHLALSQPVASRWRALLADDSVAGLHFVSFGAQYGSAVHSVAARFDTRTHAVGLSGRWAGLEVSLTSDSLNWRRASTLGASISLVRRH